ncbi:MAG: SHOCT domain-containing protein [Thaumarchaeota archaeon]|nr:SHOCT domain-containing protein [Nitrososphaerota archaeon]
MTGKYADSNNAFQIIVNTNDQNQFNLKGTYSASAFVNSKQDGKTIFFDFSPDGSPVFHPSESKNNAIFSQNEVNGPSKQETNSNNTFLSDENVKIVDFVNMSKKIAPNNNRSEVISSSPELANVLYPLMAACGAGLVGFIIYQRKKRTRGISEQSNEKSVLKIESDQDYALKILKNRLAKGEITLEEFKMTRDALSEP